MNHELDVRPRVLWTEWRADCSCGWTGSYLPTETQARAEGARHQAQEAETLKEGEMDDRIRQIHYRAGEAYGREATCGIKVDYRTEESAERARIAMVGKSAKPLEAYPCFWCHGWHLGRAMTPEEWQRFAEPVEEEAP